MVVPVVLVVLSEANLISSPSGMKKLFRSLP
jgi:hypothetical protein